MKWASDYHHNRYFSIWLISRALRSILCSSSPFNVLIYLSFIKVRFIGRAETPNESQAVYVSLRCFPSSANSQKYFDWGDEGKRLRTTLYWSFNFLLFVLWNVWFIPVSVSGDGAQVLQLRLHLHLCDRGLAEARGLRLPALLQGQVRGRDPQLFSDAFGLC